MLEGCPGFGPELGDLEGSRKWRFALDWILSDGRTNFVPGWLKSYVEARKNEVKP